MLSTPPSLIGLQVSGVNEEGKGSGEAQRKRVCKKDGFVGGRLMREEEIGKGCRGLKEGLWAGRGSEM